MGKDTRIEVVCEDSRAVNQCASVGLVTVGDFRNKYETSITEIYGLTDRTVNKVAHAIRAAGFSLKVSPYYELYLSKDENKVLSLGCPHTEINELIQQMAVDYFGKNKSIKAITKEYWLCDESLTLHMLRVWWKLVKNKAAIKDGDTKVTPSKKACEKNFK